MSRDLSDIREVIMRMSGGTAISPRAESAQGERRGQHCLCLRNSKKADAVETDKGEGNEKRWGEQAGLYPSRSFLDLVPESHSKDFR